MGILTDRIALATVDPEAVKAVEELVRRRQEVSKPTYPWWGYVKNMVEHHEDRLQRIRAWDKDLTKTELKEAVAVEWAKNKTLLDYPEDGAQRLEMIRTAYWDGETRNLEEAAAELGISWPTAKRWHTEFILLVAQPFGLLE